jgi:cell division protein ZapA (FtsZ GTPase activity inhibitor)
MTDKKSVAVRVFGQKYSIVSSEKPATTLGYAKHVNTVMQQISKNSGVNDTSRVAILALLQIVHELSTLKKQLDDGVNEYNQYKDSLTKLLSEIDKTIEEEGI